MPASTPAASHPLDAVAKLNTAAAFPSGAHIAEVEIDPETGVLELLSYVAVDDCGTIYNHKLVEGQLLGGMMQGIGQIMGEHCVYDRDSGQFLTGTFMDYYMPRADLLPDDLAARPSDRLAQQSARRQGRRRGRHDRRHPDRRQCRHGCAGAGRASITSTCRIRRTPSGRRSNGPGNRSRTETVRHLSIPKIISARSDDAIRPRLVGSAAAARRW